MRGPRLSWGSSQRAQAIADAAWQDAIRKRGKKQSAKAHAKRKAKRGNKPAPFVGTYHEYLDSPQWAKKRRKARKHYGGKCTICGSTHNLHVHHRHYRTLFREAVTDLDLLCGGCHANTHEEQGVVDPMTARYLSLGL